MDASTFERIDALERNLREALACVYDLRSILAGENSGDDYSSSGLPVSRSDEGGGLIVDLVEQRVSVGGTELHLTRKEFDAMRLLAPGRLVPYERFGVLWPDGVGNNDMVANLISRLRAKVGDAVEIENIREVGYRLN